MGYIKAADEIYKVGRVAAPYVKKGYEDIRNHYRHRDEQDLGFGNVFKGIGKGIEFAEDHKQEIEDAYNIGKAGYNLYKDSRR